MSNDTDKTSTTEAIGCDCLVCRGRRFDGVPIHERMHLPIRYAFAILSGIKSRMN